MIRKIIIIGDAYGFKKDRLHLKKFKIVVISVTALLIFCVFNKFMVVAAINDKSHTLIEKDFILLGIPHVDVHKKNDYRNGA